MQSEEIVRRFKHLLPPGGRGTPANSWWGCAVWFYNLGRNKMEQQTPIPPKSRMKSRKSQNAPFSHLWFGGEGGGLRFFIYFVQDCRLSHKLLGNFSASFDFFSIFKIIFATFISFRKKHQLNSICLYYCVDSRAAYHLHKPPGWKSCA